jgi:hypothetical protein
MASRLTVGALVLVSAVVPLALPCWPARADEKGAKAELPLGRDAWDMRRLEQDPVKLVKVTYYPATREVKWVLEFTRDLTVRDIDWHSLSKSAPFWFRFQDEDGVTLVSASAAYDGVLVGLRGRRVRVVLKLPDEEVMRRTKKVMIDPRPYGE